MTKINLLLSLVILFIFSSCTSKGKINEMEYDYGIKPTRIVWLQIPGLSEEYLSLLKFYSTSTDTVSEFERFHCLGKMWNFSIKDLRSNSDASFLTQMSGQKNMMNECSDFEVKPLWKLVDRTKFKVGYFDDAKAASKCEKQKASFFDGATTWNMTARPKNGLYFHADETENFKQVGAYYDRSCSDGKCYSEFNDNILSTFKRFIYGKNFYFYIARINKLEKLIESQKIDDVYHFLKKLDILIGELKRELASKPDTLLLLTTASVKGVELPTQGNAWGNKKDLGASTLFKRRQTLSPVFAYGAKAEAFCGLFEQSDIPRRILKSY